MKQPKSYYGRFDTSFSNLGGGIFAYIQTQHNISKLARIGIGKITAKELFNKTIQIQAKRNPTKNIAIIGHIDHGRTTMLKAEYLAHKVPLNLKVMNPKEKTIDEIKKENYTLPITYPYNCLSSVPNVNYSLDKYNYDKEAKTRAKNKAKRKAKNKSKKRNKR